MTGGMLTRMVAARVVQAACRALEDRISALSSSQGHDGGVVVVREAAWIA